MVRDRYNEYVKAVEDRIEKSHRIPITTHLYNAESDTLEQDVEMNKLLSEYFTDRGWKATFKTDSVSDRNGDTYHTVTLVLR